MKAESSVPAPAAPTTVSESATPATPRSVAELGEPAMALAKPRSSASTSIVWLRQVSQPTMSTPCTVWRASRSSSMSR